MNKLFLWSVLFGGAITIASCGSPTTNDTTKDPAVATESAPLVTEEAAIPEANLTAEELKDYAVNTYHYDPAFGEQLPATAQKFQNSLNGYQELGTNILFADHKLAVTSHYHKEKDSIVSSFYYDSVSLASLKQSDGQQLNAVKLSFSSAPVVYKFDIDGNNYFFVKGTPLNVSGKAAAFTYGLVFDIHARTVYYISTLNEKGEFFFKKKNGHLAYMESLPEEGEDKLLVNEKVLNF
jgi:hypothetical protein